MNDPKSKRQAAANKPKTSIVRAHPDKRKTPDRKVGGRQTEPPALWKNASRSESKQTQILAMLCAPRGATIATIMDATGWQQHSVRGFLAGVVRKKLGFNLVSERTEKVRIYRIKHRKGSMVPTPPGQTAGAS